MEGAGLYKPLHQALYRRGHLLPLLGGGVHLPLHNGQTALHIVHRQQGEGGHVLLVEHNRVANLKVHDCIMLHTILSKLTDPSPEENCLVKSPYLFIRTFASPWYQWMDFSSKGARHGSI